MDLKIEEMGHVWLGYRMVRAGIVGLPNVGKSTLFNAVTRTRKAQAANYPFCTIEPNVGMVTVPDSRLDWLAKMSGSEKILPASIELVDIAGLVKGASQGEGLGNQFLTHIREVDAIIQVVRCFEDADIHHVAGTVDPLRDIETIMTELVLADLGTVTKRLDKPGKAAKQGDAQAKAELALLARLKPHLDAGKPALTLEMTDDEKKVVRSFFLLTTKPTLFACNVKEDATVDAADVVAVSQDVSAPEASKTEAVVQPGVITSVPAATPSVATPAGEVAGGAAPLVAPAAGAGAASGVTSTVTPTSSGLTAGAPSTLPATTSTTTVPVK